MKNIKEDPEGLKRLLLMMGFNIIEEGENIIASGKDYNSSGDKVWKDNIEEILVPSAYGYNVEFQRWKIVFTPFKG